MACWKKGVAVNNFFSFRRFGRLFVKHTREYIRTYLMSLFVLLGVLVLAGFFFFFVLPEPPDTGFQEASYAIMLILAGTIFTSTVFQDFGDRTRAIPALTLPASGFEKFLVGWLYSYVIFILVYTGVFYLALSGLVTAKNSATGKHFSLFSPWEPDIILAFVFFSVLHAVALFGSAFFRKLHFIKTGFIFFIVLVVTLVFNTLFLKAITGLSIVKMAIPFGFADFAVNDREYSAVVIGRGPFIDMGTLLVAAVLLWVAAYYKLKEKQV
jgi:hypothetical protein